MKKSVLAALAAVMLLSGCSGVSQESGNSVTDENTSSQTESNSSSTTTSSSTSEISETDNNTNSNNKELEEKFNAKCKNIVEQMFSFADTTGYSMQLTEPIVNYNDNSCLTKIYVVKASGNGEDDRIMIAFLDINSTDEYEYFQSAKSFINFVDENALEICGRNQYMIAINPTEDNLVDISISKDTYGIDVTYGNRDIRSAYSERLKSMDLFKECDEQLTLPGLLRFDDLPKDCTPYDVTCEYQGKTLTHKWYKLDGGSVENTYVTYIDDGTYNSITDEELIAYAYMSLFDPQNNGKTYSCNNFYFAYKSGEKIACSIFYYPSDILRNLSSCHWIGEYEYLNSNAFNINLLNALKGQTE